MEKQTDKQICCDTTKPLKVRKEAFARILEKQMNPCKKKDFDPETFDINKDSDMYELSKRPREEPPARLPCMKLKPKKIREGQMVGMFETKQDLYLLIACLYNRVADLEEEVGN